MHKNISYLTIFRAMSCLPLSLTNQSITVSGGRVPEMNLTYFALNLLCFSSIFLGEAAISSRRFCLCGPCQLLSCLAAKKRKDSRCFCLASKWMDQLITDRLTDDEKLFFSFFLWLQFLGEQMILKIVTELGDCCWYFSHVCIYYGWLYLQPDV